MRHIGHRMGSARAEANALALAVALPLVALFCAGASAGTLPSTFPACIFNSSTKTYSKVMAYPTSKALGTKDAWVAGNEQNSQDCSTTLSNTCTVISTCEFLVFQG